MQKIRKQIFFVIEVVALIVTLSGCTRFRTGARNMPFLLDGPAGQEVGVYKVRHDTKKNEVTYIPYAKVFSKKEVQLEPGTYLIANECSGFLHKHEGPSKIAVNHVKLALPESEPETVVPTASSATSATATSMPIVVKKGGEKIVHVECVDPIDGHRSNWNDRKEFFLLPGTTKFYVGGRPVVVENREISKPVERVIELFPLTVVAPEGLNSHERFFVSPEDLGEQSDVAVVSVAVGNTLWLLPGTYNLEINGSRRKIGVDKGAHVEVPLGVLRIETPGQFMKLAESQGGESQPIFAYINDAVLFNLNSDYLVFPGRYAVSIGGSDLKENFIVEASKRTEVKTLGAVVELPPCQGSKKLCKSPPKITIHKERNPFALMYVEPGVPFLVLDAKFEYGVEGTRGILRDLMTSKESVHREKLARLKINWEVRRSERKQKTELVRIESRGAPNYGKTLDLLFHKPDEIFVPAGVYHLSYLSIVPGLEPVKNRIDLAIREGETREVVVPIYPEKVEPGNEHLTRAQGLSDPSDKLPSRLIPIHR